MDIIQVVSRAVSILLKDTKTTEKVCIEAYIYALQYVRYCTNADNQAYIFAVEYVYKMIPEECAMSFDTFGDYFETRCQWYEEMHCKVAKAKQEGNNMPIAWGIMQHLIFTFPLQNVDKKDVGQYAFTHTGIFENMNFIVNSMSMFSFLHDTLDTNRGQIDGDIDEIQQMHDDLIEEYGCCKAIDIVIGKLVNELSHHSNTGWSEEIDKHLRVLELLQPINGESKYTHFTTPEALAEIATIDYIKISDAITEFTRMAYNADVRSRAILTIMTDPNMKIQANKLHQQKRLYENTIDNLVKIQNHIAKTLHNEHKLEDTGNILSSKMYSIDGIACGFIANGKLYINSDMGNHKAPIHLYTYVWMKHCKKVEPELFNKIYDYAVTTDYFQHIRFSPRFSDLDIEEAAIKAFCYLTSFDAKDIFLDETKKQELLMKLKTAECENELLIRYPLAAFIKKEDVSLTLKTL